MDERHIDTDQPSTSPTAEPRRARRGRRTLLAVALAGGLAVGGAGVAAAAGASSSASAPSGSSAASGSGTASAPDGATEAPSAPEAGGPAGPGGPAGGPGAGPEAGPDGEHAHQPHLDGEVASVSDDSFTLVDHDGFTRTVSTSDDTTYGAGGPDQEDATEDRGDVLVEGAMVSAVGEVADDGTTLAASAVQTRPEPPQPPSDAPQPPSDAPQPPSDAPQPPSDAAESSQAPAGS